MHARARLASAAAVSPKKNARVAPLPPVWPRALLRSRRPQRRVSRAMHADSALHGRDTLAARMAAIVVPGGGGAGHARESGAGGSKHRSPIALRHAWVVASGSPQGAVLAAPQGEAGLGARLRPLTGRSGGGCHSRSPGRTAPVGPKGAEGAQRQRVGRRYEDAATVGPTGAHAPLVRKALPTAAPSLMF